MNRADYLDPALCWTGCKDTGRSGALSVAIKTLPDQSPFFKS